MKSMIFMISGCLGMSIALMHGYQGQTRCVIPVQHPAESSKRVLSAVMLISAINWFIVGGFLVLAPWILSPYDQKLVALAALFFYVPGAIGNFWATRGQHIGWFILAGTSVLIAIGLAV